MKDPQLIVSLTSWRGRIYSDLVHQNIFRLLRQKTSFSYLVTLVLSTDEFPKREAELPKPLLMMVEKEPLFNIVWVKNNTRALKKLVGAQLAFSELPILTTDDDIAVKESFVEEFMRCHLEHPKDIISAHLWKHATGIEVTGWARLFPPHSLAMLPDSMFMKYLHGLEDDIWNGMRAYLVGTQHRKLGSWPFEAEVEVGSALRDEYLRTNVATMLAEFVKGWKPNASSSKPY